MQNHSTWLVGIIVTSLFLAGVFYSYALGDQVRFLPDEPDYLTLSENIILVGQYTLDGPQPTAYRAPGYPFFLAIFRALGLNIVGLRCLNFLLLSLTMLMVYRILGRVASPMAGLLGVVLSAGYGVLFYMAGTFYPQNLAGFLFVFTLERLLQTKPGVSAWVVAGISTGWLILTVPAFIFVLPIFLAWQVVTQVNWRGALVTLLSAGLLVSAWVVRNQIAMGEMVFIATNSGENLLLGNAPQTTPNAGTLVDISGYRQQADSLGLNEVKRDRYFRDLVWNYWRDDPAQALKMYFLKFLNYFNFRNNLATQTETSVGRDLVMLVTYYPLLFLGILRLSRVKTLLRHPETILFAALYLGSALVYAVFFTRLRFRLPFDYLLILLAAGLVAGQLQRLLDTVKNTELGGYDAKEQVI